MSTRRVRLLVHNVRSLWNVGAFFRTCDALGVEYVHLTGYTATPPRKEITKTAIGAEAFVPWDAEDDPHTVVDRLRADGWQIVALERHPEAVPLHEARLADKTCLIVGHELSGVPASLLAASDVRVEIPMLGQKESLNVAVAAGIALYACRFASI